MREDYAKQASAGAEGGVPGTFRDARDKAGHPGTGAVLAALRPAQRLMMGTSNVDTDTFGSRIRLKELRVQHRDLDVAIAELIKNPHADQLRVNRLKKQKLRLKDMISRLESQLIPDLNA